MASNLNQETHQKENKNLSVKNTEVRHIILSVGFQFQVKGNRVRKQVRPATACTVGHGRVRTRMTENSKLG